RVRSEETQTPRRLLGLVLLASACSVPAPAQSPASPAAAEVPRAGPALQPASIPPGSPEDRETAITRGAAYLCRSQNPDGSWGSARWTGGVDRDPVPGAFHSFDVATTALCLEALLSAGDAPEVKLTLARAEAFVLENLPKLRRADEGNVPNVWGSI